MGEITNRLYLVLPDKNGKFPEDEGCEEGFSSQLDIIKYIETIHEGK